MDIRAAQPGDEDSILDLIKGLAEFENEPQAVDNTAEKLRADLFEHNHCDALVAVDNNEVIGFALFYTSYSTWKGPCLYLEDIYITPDKRHTGAGSMLF
ncbi:MAG: GNAT family N-acetyltransferase, partial [Crocinitomicaceae bacterium]|nr:GNAT family N-acetyltransferase [Crocinitomicaceae bacterium]